MNQATKSSRIVRCVALGIEATLTRRERALAAAARRRRLEIPRPLRFRSAPDFGDSGRWLSFWKPSPAGISNGSRRDRITYLGEPTFNRSFWITDLVAQETVPISHLMWTRYGEYLEGHGGVEYRHKVLDYIDREDSPRPVPYQLDLLRRVGVAHVELLHKNGCFAAFGAWKE